MSKTVMVQGKELELEERTCIFKRCGRKFRVLKNSVQKTCGTICFDLYNNVKGRDKYRGLKRNY